MIASPKPCTLQNQCSSGHLRCTGRSAWELRASQGCSVAPLLLKNFKNVPSALTLSRGEGWEAIEKMIYLQNQPFHFLS